MSIAGELKQGRTCKTCGVGRVETVQHNKDGWFVALACECKQVVRLSGFYAEWGKAREALMKGKWKKP